MNTKINNNDFINSKKEGRVIAFQTLFSYETNKFPIEELLQFKWLDKGPVSQEALNYAKFLVEGTINYLSMIDSTIKARLKKWDFDRVSNIEKAVLRFSVFSMFFEKDLDSNIIINEAIEIVKQYGAKDSYKFVNGILDAIKRAGK